MGGGEGALLRKSEDGLRMRYNLILRHFCINKKEKKMYINYETWSVTQDLPLSDSLQSDWIQFVLQMEIIWIHLIFYLDRERKKTQWHFNIVTLIKEEVLLTVSCPIFPSILIAKNLLTGSLKNRSIDNLETQKKSISMKNSQFLIIYSMQIEINF